MIVLLHLDPTTPTGLLDALGHLAPLWLSGAGSFLTLNLARLRDGRK
jgi:hypothetical protein